MLDNHLLAQLHKHSNDIDTAVFEWKRLALAGDNIINMFAVIVQDTSVKENDTLSGLWDLQSTSTQRRNFTELFSFTYHPGFDRPGYDQYLIKSATLCEAYLFLENKENGWYISKTKLLEWFQTKCSRTQKNTTRIGQIVVRYNLVTRLLQNPNMSAHSIEQICKRKQPLEPTKYAKIGQQFIQTQSWDVDTKLLPH
jgi:hypothetical protein